MIRSPCGDEPLEVFDQVRRDGKRANGVLRFRFLRASRATHSVSPAPGLSSRFRSSRRNPHNSPARSPVSAASQIESTIWLLRGAQNPCHFFLCKRECPRLASLRQHDAIKRIVCHVLPSACRLPHHLQSDIDISHRFRIGLYVRDESAEPCRACTSRTAKRPKNGVMYFRRWLRRFAWVDGLCWMSTRASHRFANSAKRRGRSRPVHRIVHNRESFLEPAPCESSGGKIPLLLLAENFRPAYAADLAFGDFILSPAANPYGTQHAAVLSFDRAGQ